LVSGLKLIIRKMNEKLLSNNFEINKMDQEFMKDGKFDYVRKFDYDSYNEVYQSIPDDATNLDQTLSDLKEAFMTHETKKKAFRIQ